MRGTGFAAAAPLTVTGFEVPVIDATSASVAVMVRLPAVLSAAGKIAVPFAKVELGGRSAWPSVLVKLIVSE